MKTKLEVKNLCYSYHTLEGETQALADITFDVKDGEFFAIVGPSGCGKSTLLSLLCGLIEPESGQILIDGTVREKSHTAMGYMLQKDHLFEWRTIFSNVALGLEIQNRLDEEARGELLGMLDTYGLSQFRDAKPSQLSGGMRQRAAFLRTALCQADILLLDEPFGALDVITRGEMQDWLLHLRRKFERTVILVTHDMDEAIYLSDRILILNQSPAGIVDEILIDAEVRDREWLYSQGQLRRKIYGRIMGRADAGSAQSRQGPEEEAHGVMQRKRNER